MPPTESPLERASPTPVQLAKARLLELGLRHDAALPAAVHPLWRTGAAAGLGVLVGTMLAGRRRQSSPVRVAAAVARLAATGLPWVASWWIRR